MKLFDTYVQKQKYKVLREAAKLEFAGELSGLGLLKISETIIPSGDQTMRCCIYKERAVISEMLNYTIEKTSPKNNVIRVLSIACDECPVSQIDVTEACRGCISHRCMDSCPKGAISMVDHRACIDKDKCIMCGKCIDSCPYTAIRKELRPCENACKVKAINMGEDRKAHIDDDKCIACGACVYQCPFGAIMDKPLILDAVRILKESDYSKKYPVYAVVAPSISGQFQYPLGQIISAIKKLGFYSVIEAALGADMVAYKEAEELKEKGFLTSSCCPAFVRYIETKFPELQGHVSHNLSPMAEMAKQIKKLHSNCKIIFIGPCTAKKAEFQKPEVKKYVDCVITFEDLQALIDSKDIDPSELSESLLDNASYYGRIFARSGGLSDAVAQALKEQGTSEDEFKLNGIICNGISECHVALLKASKNMLKENFIEGMACSNGCIGGAACLTHGPKDKEAVNKYGEAAMEKTISDAISIWGMQD